MIIKSLARKRPGFRQLIGYIDRSGGEAFSRNLYGATSPGDVARAFEQNHTLLSKRRNGNSLYHEVLVLPPQPDLSEAQQTKILRKLADRYCELRAPGNLAWGVAHHDTDNSHIHLMISANAAQSRSRTRLSKAQFADIQSDMEREARSRFPELIQTNVYEKPAQTKRGKRTREDAMERYSQVMSQKAFIAGQIEYYLPLSTTAGELKTHLAKINFELYQRGQHIGVRNKLTGKRYRLKNLGLEAAFARQQQVWERADQAKARRTGDRTKPTQQQPDTRAADLLRQRREQADRILRDFDLDR